jgi:ABC-type nitrate/sulfonate/bicarbonate transport system substrate-binding protein
LKLAASSGQNMHMLRVRITPIISLSFLLLAGNISQTYAAETSKTVQMMTRALGDSTVIYEIGQRLGFYQEEGFKLELILAKISTATQALLAGNADYLNHGSAIPVILRGMPLKVLLVDSDRPPHFIVTAPQINSFQDIAGKVFAIDDHAGASALVVREVLAKNSVPLEKVNFRVLGPPPLRLQALLSGVVHAAPLNFVMATKAKSQGFKILAYTGDFTSDVQLSVAAPVVKMQAAKDEIYRFVRATLKAQMFFFENPSDEAFKFYMEVNDLTDQTVAREAWQVRMKRTSETARLGLLTQQTMEEQKNRLVEQLKLGGAPLEKAKFIRAEEAYDFSFARQAYAELKAAGWQTSKYRWTPKK